MGMFGGRRKGGGVSGRLRGGAGGAIVGGMAGGGAGAVAGAAGGAAGGGGYLGKASRGDLRGSLEDVSSNLGFSSRKENEAEDAAREATEAGYESTKGYLDKMATQEDAYYGDLYNRGISYRDARNKRMNDYANELDTLRGEVEGQAKRADETYSNTVLPELKNIMERAKTDSADAMSLKEAGDPNNAVQRAVRDLYDQQAQGVGKQGLADSGVLQAMGAQSIAGQLGSSPMTGGQMASLFGASQSQAGQAYSRAQGQMQRLREQGLERGFSESDKQFQRGQQAHERYRQGVGDYEGAAGRREQMASGFRGEKRDLGREKYGTNLSAQDFDYGFTQGMADTQQGMKMGQLQRGMGAAQDYYGGLAGQAQGNLAAAQANQSGKIGVWGNLAAAGVQAAGSAAGGGGGGGGGGQAGAPMGQAAQAGVQGQMKGQQQQAYQGPLSPNQPPYGQPAPYGTQQYRPYG